jgi:hypothetical protein
MNPYAILTEVYKIYEQDSTIPDTTADDFTIRLSYLNRSIGKWENQPGVEWKVLYEQATGVTDNNGQATLPVDFKKPDSVLIIGNQIYQYLRPTRFDLEVSKNTGLYYYTVVGSKGAFTLKTQPANPGVAYSLDYKKYAFRSVTGMETQDIDMDNPEFAIQDVLAQIYDQDLNTDLAMRCYSNAGTAMNSMLVDNEASPHNSPQTLQDEDFLGFGN